MDKEIFMWVIFALLSAFFAGITAVLSKVGIKNVNSDLGMAIRTIVVFVFAWLMVYGFCGRCMGRHYVHYIKNTYISRIVGSCNRGVVALLFQGVKVGRCK